MFALILLVVFGLTIWDLIETVKKRIFITLQHILSFDFISNYFMKNQIICKFNLD